ncbi:hypothetical protein CEXT_684911 [Caerostris extrusa]|uniref:Uncharacterized protein n=1 Tax=Caerostris extrusa TaxID=172846 RepID=A0AAV4NUN2_CAEEX|nr:hypothetical protein CEXT_684911 [Caerostris extrusa]
MQINLGSTFPFLSRVYVDPDPGKLERLFAADQHHKSSSREGRKKKTKSSILEAPLETQRGCDPFFLSVLESDGGTSGFPIAVVASAFRLAGIAFLANNR